MGARPSVGQILDMVPSHVGVMGGENRWWMDVLENGPAYCAAYRAGVLRLAMKLQQHTGPFTAKGLEDTAFCRYHRLVPLNDVASAAALTDALPGVTLHASHARGAFVLSAAELLRRFSVGRLTSEDNSHD